MPSRAQGRRRALLRANLEVVARAYFRRADKADKREWQRLARTILMLLPEASPMILREFIPLLESARAEKDWTATCWEARQVAADDAQGRTSVAQLLHLSLVFMMFGFASAAGRYRTAAVENALLQIPRSGGAHAQSILAYLESNDGTDSPRYARLASTLGRSKRAASDALEIHQTLTGVSRANTKDAHFFDFVHGQDVVLVGPATLGESEKEIVERATLLARIGGDLVRHGGGQFNQSRADIIYFAGETPRLYPEAIEQHEQWGRRNGTRFFVYKRPDKRNRSIGCRTALTPQTLYFAGSPMLLPLAAYDILVHKPRLLHVVGANLYTTSNAHRDNYFAVGNPVGYRLWPGFAHHDIVSQKRFFEMIKLNRRVQLGQSLAQSTSMVDQDYLARIETVHAPDFGWYE